MQTITIAGRLARDAELRHTQGGDSVCSFSVAVDQREGKDRSTNWFRVSIWGKRGESLAPYLLKGAAVTVSGSFSVSEYEGKTQLNVRANEIALQGGRGDGSQGAPVEPQRDSRQAPVDDLDSDSIPFVTANGVW
jgi:single-strand DNA-binding protein